MVKTLKVLFVLACCSFADCQVMQQIIAGSYPNIVGNPIYVQSVITECSASPCTITALQGFQAGDIEIVESIDLGSATISGASGGGTWALHHSGGTSTIATQSSFTTDLASIVGATTGTTAVSVTFSAAPGAAELQLYEIKPPPGFTASYGTSGSNSSAACTTCTGTALTLSGPAFIFQGVWITGSAASVNGWSSPYTMDNNNNGLAFGLSSGTAPTFTANASGEFVNSTIAFTFTGPGVFTAPTFPVTYSIIQAPNNVLLTGCETANPCTITIPSTGTGHAGLLVMMSKTGASQTNITALTGAGTATIPGTGAGTCNKYSSTGGSITCAIIPSTTSGATTLTVTMNHLDAACCWYDWLELGRSSGTWTLDTQNSSSNAANIFPAGQALTTSGSNDVCFTFVEGQTGTFTGQSYYYLPPYGGGSNNNAPEYGSTGLLFNSNGCPAFNWQNSVSEASVVGTIALK